MVLLLFVLLSSPLALSAPTTNHSTAPYHTTEAPHETEVITSNSTDPSNETETFYVGLRGSIQKEIVFLRGSYENLRRDLYEWMNTPYHRDVVIPASIGVASALVSLLLYYSMKLTWRRCVRTFRRTRLSRMSGDLNGDKKRMLPRKDDSDDDDL